MSREGFLSENFRKIKPYFHLKVSLSVIYYIGTWPPRGNYRVLYLVGTVCSFILMLGIFLTTELADLIASWGNAKEMLNGATLLLLTNSVHAYKLFVVLFRQKRIQALVDMTESEAFSRDNARYERILSQYTWNGIFHYVVYQALGASAVMFWGTTPIADFVAGRGRRLPMEGLYPYNTTVTPAFEITTFYQNVALMFACFHNLAIDNLFAGLIIVACCQLAFLKRNIATINDKFPTTLTTPIKTFKENKSPKYKENWEESVVDLKGSMINKNDLLEIARSKEVDPDETLNNELKKCVEHSKIIFAFVEELENTFGTAIFLQFFVNCLILCLTAFHISQMTVYVPEVVIGMLLYGFCMTYQIFTYCWHGNELQIHTTEVAFGAYSSRWWIESTRFKRALQIIITRTQQPLILRAGNIMQLSLHTFVGIIHMSYSIFTVLQSTSKSS